MKNKKFLAYFIASILLLFMFVVALLSSKGFFGDPGDSATMDEVAHIPAGYSMAKYLDYRLNPEHPPISKFLSGLSLSFHHVAGIKDSSAFQNIDQWGSGLYMLYGTSNNPAQLLLWARIPTMILMIILGFFIFQWAYELFGAKVSLFVLSMFVLYPDIIAHGRLVTTDVAAALGFVIAAYYFHKCIEKNNLKNQIFTGLALGLAELFKFSAVILPAIFILLILIRVFINRKEQKPWLYLKELSKMLGVIFLVALGLIWLVYIPLVWNTPAGIEHKLIEMNLTSDPKTLILRNFLHLFENNPFTRAIGHYLLGVMLVFSRVEGGNNTFIMGHVSDKSISWFFPVAWLIKTPITIIILFLTSLGFIFKKIISKSLDNSNKWLISLLFVPVLVYWIITLKGQLDLGIRHLMPTIPFVLLLIGYLLYYLFNTERKAIYISLVGVLVLFMGWSTMSNYPNFISYFNEFVPKTDRYKYLVDSSLDWGQDLLRLKKYTDDNKIDYLKIDYFGGSKPSYYFPNFTEWHAANGPTTGWLAVSATYYQSSKMVASQTGESSYSWLDNIKPKAIIGDSILVYNITSYDLANVSGK